MFACVQVGDFIVATLAVVALVGFIVATRNWPEEKFRSLFIGGRR